MGKTMISVIIPVYNVEKYIERCARSLFEQTLEEGIEFIFVNDATSDDSIIILQQVLSEYPQRRNQVQIINNQNNIGSAKARPIGWEHAEGIYLANCDSDDWVEANTYELLLSKALEEDSDFVWCDYFDSTEVKDIFCSQAASTDSETLISSYLTGHRGAYTWNKIFKKELITQDFVYPEYDMTEDFTIIVQLVMKAKRIGYCPSALYHHFVNPLSITCNPAPDKILANHKGIVNNTEIILSILGKAGLSEKYKEEIICKKNSCKEILSLLLNQKEYRQLWRNTYKGINNHILSNRFISMRSKLKAFLLLGNMWPLCNLLLNFKRRLLN